MSIHKSLRLHGAMARQRNVYTRWERLQKLQEQGRWVEGTSVYGLPKVRTLVVKAGRKKKKKGPEDEAKAEEGAAVATPGETPTT